MNDINHTETVKSVPIACNLPDDKRVERGEDLSVDLFSGCKGVAELSDGYSFRFPGDKDWALKLVQFINDERECCPFFRFELTFESAAGPIWLGMTGAEGVKEFLRENFPVAMRD